MEAALAEFSAGRVAQPLRTVLEVGEQNAFFGVMPAYMPSLPALGTKLVTVFAATRRAACRPTSRRSSCSTRRPARCSR